MPKNIDRQEFERLMACIEEARATMERILPVALEPLRPGFPPEPVVLTAEAIAKHHAASARLKECGNALHVMLGGVASE